LFIIHLFAETFAKRIWTLNQEGQMCYCKFNMTHCRQNTTSAKTHFIFLQGTEHDSES